MRFAAFLVPALLLFGGQSTGRAESQSAGQETVTESHNDLQKLFRFMAGIHNYTAEFRSRSQILEAIANGDADGKWMLYRGGDENQPRGRVVMSSIVYSSTDGYSVYSLAIRCDHAYTTNSEFYTRLAKFNLTDDGQLSEVLYNETGFHRALGSSFDQEFKTLMSRGAVTGEALARELLSSIDLSGVPPAYRAPANGLPRILPARTASQHRYCPPARQIRPDLVVSGSG
jgi:hypothetical protein